MTLSNTLLRLYPRAWRDRYEEEFTALLEQDHPSVMDVLDTALGALDAHLRPQVTAAQVKSEGRKLVSRESFIRWSGMSGMAGSVLLLLGFFGIALFQDNEYPYGYDGWDVGTRTLFVAGVALTFVFTVGCLLAYGRKTRNMGQIGLLIALTGLLSMGVGGAGNLTVAIRGVEINGWWEFFIFGWMATLVGCGIFSIAGSTEKVLPSITSIITAIGALACVTALLFSMLFAYDIGGQTPVAQLLLGVMTVSLMIFQLGLVLLGYAVWSGHVAAARRIDPAPVV